MKKILTLYNRGPGLSNFMLCGCVCARRQMCVLKSYPYNDSVCVCVCVFLRVCVCARARATVCLHGQNSCVFVRVYVCGLCSQVKNNNTYMHARAYIMHVSNGDMRVTLRKANG
jgi:hypothetical protein